MRPIRAAPLTVSARPGQRGCLNSPQMQQLAVTVGSVPDGGAVWALTLCSSHPVHQRRPPSARGSHSSTDCQPDDRHRPPAAGRRRSRSVHTASVFDLISPRASGTQMPKVF